MGRLMNEDFHRLLEFLNSYKLTASVGDKEFQKILASCHKRYYSYLVFVVELHQQSGYSIQENQYDYLLESVSDVGQSLFSFMNGCYKGACLLLRSSIENFIKAVCLKENPNIILEKSVYKIFDLAKASTVFKMSKSGLYDSIHNQYVELCKDVHTASILNMDHITALNVFPKFDSKKAEQVCGHFNVLLSAYVTLLSVVYNDFYHSLYYKNKEIVAASILTSFKKEINNIEE